MKEITRFYKLSHYLKLSQAVEEIHEPIVLEIQDIICQLINIYKATDNLQEQQYIFSKLKDILREVDAKEYSVIYKIVFRAILDITESTVKVEKKCL